MQPTGVKPLQTICLICPSDLFCMDVWMWLRGVLRSQRFNQTQVRQSPPTHSDAPSPLRTRLSPAPGLSSLRKIWASIEGRGVLSQPSQQRAASVWQMGTLRVGTCASAQSQTESKRTSAILNPKSHNRDEKCETMSGISKPKKKKYGRVGKGGGTKVATVDTC